MILTLLISVLTCLLLGGGYQCVNIFPEKIKVTVSQIDLDPTTSVQGVCVRGVTKNYSYSLRFNSISIIVFRFQLFRFDYVNVS